MIVKNWVTKELKDIDTKVYSNDMEEVVQCPECLKRVKFGELYNTGDWFEPKGIWRIGICEDCAERWWKQSDKRKNDNRKK
jgi:hypothetical protein